MTDGTAVERVYRSRMHPGTTPGAVVFGQALARPLGVCMLPPMIAALVMMLQSLDPMITLWVGAPIAFVVAWAWTLHRLRGDLAQIRMDRGMARVSSVLDVVRGRADGPGEAVLDVRQHGDDLDATVGLETFRLRHGDWPEWAHLAAGLRQARVLHVERVRERLGGGQP